MFLTHRYNGVVGSEGMVTGGCWERGHGMVRLLGEVVRLLGEEAVLGEEVRYAYP